MKSKSYVMLLLTTTFLVGCGSGGGVGNQNANKQNGGGNANQPFDGIAVSDLRGADILLKASTVEEALKLPEIKAKVSSMMPLWKSINKRNLPSGYNNLASIEGDDAKRKNVELVWSSFSKQARETFIKEYKEFEEGISDILIELQKVALKPATHDLAILPDTNQSSWSQVVQHIVKRKEVSDRLKMQPDIRYDFQIPALLKFPMDNLGNLQYEHFVDFSPNPSLEAKQFRDEFEMWWFRNKEIKAKFEKLYAGITSDEVKLLVDQMFTNKIDVSSIEESLRQHYKQLINNKVHVVGILKDLCSLGLFQENFKSPTYIQNGSAIPNDAYKIGNSLYLAADTRLKADSDYIKFIRSTRPNSQKAIWDHEKFLISAMIKSGQFKGLFDYLKDRKIKLGNKEYTPFPAAEYDALVAQAPQQRLAAGISPSTLPRGARDGDARVNATHLQINGIAGGKVAMGLPLSIHLKGNIDGTKSTAGTSGTVAYKMGNTVVGVVHAYANTGEGFEVGSHQTETSVAVSQSFGNMFVEAQLGVVDTHHVHSADMSGSRYQLSLGYDTQYVSPFVQIAYRDFGKLTDTVGYVGAELNIDSLRADTYSVDVTMTAKAGYSTHSAWQGSLEWSAALNLDSGIGYRSDLTLGTNEGAKFGVNLSLSR